MKLDISALVTHRRGHACKRDILAQDLGMGGLYSIVRVYRAIYIIAKYALSFYRPRMVLSQPRCVSLHYMCRYSSPSARRYGSLMPSRLMERSHGGCKCITASREAIVGGVYM